MPSKRFAISNMEKLNDRIFVQFGDQLCTDQVFA
jgi:hypothetical protein